jgi:outer membrane biosynthesis protein TonB
MDKESKTIILSVLLLHLAAVGYMAIDGASQSAWNAPPRQRIAERSLVLTANQADIIASVTSTRVNTSLQQDISPPQLKNLPAQNVKTAPAQAAAVPKVAPTASKKPTITPKQQPSPKKAIQKPLPEKKETPPLSSKASTPVKAESANKEKIQKQIDQKNALLARAKESIAKIPQTSDTMASERFLTQSNGTILQTPISNQEGTSTQPESYYAQELASALQRQLSLPEWGRVELELTINRQGKIVTIKILHTESMKNRNYLEAALLKVSASPFGTRFAGVDAHTFLLTLTN